jgi:uncharacterized protein YdhG (YjbR/CyaY superfamily)
MTIEQYITSAPPEAQPILRKIREMVLQQHPSAQETLSYKMPAFRQGHVFIYYAAFKKHIGIYPPVLHPPELVEALKPYRGPKGNLQFPYTKDIPYNLILKVIDALHSSYTIKT